MRDPARIDRILNAIRSQWKKAPDLRLGQLLCNNEPKFENNPYFLEDDIIEKSLVAAAVKDQEQPQ